MKRILLVLLSVILALSLAACGKKADSKAAPAQTASRGSSDKVVNNYSGSMPTAPTSATADTLESKSNDNVVNDNRKVIYNATVTLDVKDVGAVYDSVVSKAKEMGGYISGADIYDSSSTISVRLPAGRMNEYLSFIDTLGGTRKEQNIKSQDVTDQYTDIQARLNNYKAQEEQLLTILKKANTIDEIMKVQNEVSRVRGEIEVLQGRINLWNNLIDMCTVTVRLNKIAEIGGREVSISYITWNEFTKAISNGFKSTVNFVTRFISGIFIFIISALPVIPFIALIVWLVLRYRKRHLKKLNEK